MANLVMPMRRKMYIYLQELNDKSFQSDKLTLSMISPTSSSTELQAFYITLSLHFKDVYIFAELPPLGVVLRQKVSHRDNRLRHQTVY